MRVRKIEEMLNKEVKTADDVKFFADFLESISKEYKTQFYGYSIEQLEKMNIDEIQFSYSLK